jgi:hypothetical protein
MITLTNISKLRIVPQFGWIPDPFDVHKKDLLFSKTSMARGAMGTVSNEMDNSQFFRPVSDQFSFPACTANACADAWEAQVITDKVDAGMSIESAIASTPDLSRMFLWWNGRNEMNPNQSGNAASGCHNRLIFDVLARFGVCTEDLWPYDNALLPPENKPRPVVRPSIKASRAAFPNACGAFYSIVETMGRGALIQQALGARHNVVFGTAIDASFMAYNGTGVIQRPTGTILGLHALVICGYSHTLNAYKVRNSWSEAWGGGMRGYCWMSTDYIENYSQTNSMWVGTKGVL